jgi:hypothetical protein
MGASYIHECDKCGYTFHTSGPWEFYRNRTISTSDYTRRQTKFSVSGTICFSISQNHRSACSNRNTKVL